MGPKTCPITDDNWAHGVVDMQVYLLKFGMTKQPQNISVKHLKHLSFGMIPGYLDPRSSKYPLRFQNTSSQDVSKPRDRDISVDGAC